MSNYRRVNGAGRLVILRQKRGKKTQVSLRYKPALPRWVVLAAVVCDPHKRGLCLVLPPQGQLVLNLEC